VGEALPLGIGEVGGVSFSVHTSIHKAKRRFLDRFQVRDFPLRQRLAVITRRPGLTPWPKLFANLRSSRATELVQDFLPYVVTAWVGHTPAIAEAHYWQVTEEHFRRATQSATQALRYEGGQEVND
jgi:hypothetical protein